MKEVSTMVSVIVPIYNAGKTIRKCIESILNQTYANLEVILIDDGSTDESETIIKEFTKSDSRVLYCKKTNGGVSSARNLGISMAGGEYIAFIDADDQVHRQMLEMLVFAMETYNGDLVMCQYTTNEYIVHKEIQNCEIIKLDEEDYFHEVFIPTYFTAAFVWNRLYKMDLIRSKGIRFDESIRVCEDTLFNYIYAKNCRNIIALKAPFYYYNINKDSAMHSVKFNINKLSGNVVYDYILSSEMNSKVVNDVQVACMWFNEIVIRQIYKQKICISIETKKDIKRRLGLNPIGFMKAEIPIKYKIAYILYGFLL